MCSLMNEHISRAADRPFIFDVLSVALSFRWIFTHISALLLWPHLPREIVLRGCDCKVADRAIRAAARGLEVGRQLPCPHSQLFLQALPQRGVWSAPYIIEADLSRLMDLRYDRNCGRNSVEVETLICFTNGSLLSKWYINMIIRVRAGKNRE